MDLSIVPALILLLVLLSLVLLVRRRSAPAPETVRRDVLYGPLPEDEAEQAEPSDLPGGGQVTSGAVTPGWAGSASSYYEATGVGQEGPKHLSGPPPVAATEPATPARSTSEDPWLQGSDDESGGPNLLPFVAIGGAAVGLGIFVYLRRRARRKSRWQRMREGAVSAIGAAGQAGSRLGSRAVELPKYADRRTTAGSGLSLALALAAYALVRRRSERARTEEEADGPATLLPVSTDCAGASRALALISRLRTRAAGRSTQGSQLSPRGIAIGAGGAILGLVVLRKMRGGGESEMDWTGVDVPESAPARETRY